MSWTWLLIWRYQYFSQNCMLVDEPMIVELEDHVNASEHVSFKTVFFCVVHIPKRSDLIMVNHNNGKKKKKIPGKEIA